MIKLTFSDRLRSLIEERNLTQKQVAIDLNIAPSTMGGYVQGSSEPDFDTLKRLAKYFDVTTDYLLDMHTKENDNYLDNELLRIFHSMSAEHQGLFIEQGKAFLKFDLKRKAELLKSTSEPKGSVI